MTISEAEARAWLARHEQAFNTGAWDGIMGDYTDDAVLEIHLDGQILEFEGPDAIRPILESGSAAGMQSRVDRVVVGDDVVVAQILDDEGKTFMVSFWHLRDGKIERDVSIMCNGLPG